MSRIKASRTVMCQPNSSKKEIEKLWGCQILYQDNNIVLCTQMFLRVQKKVILPA